MKKLIKNKRGFLLADVLFALVILMLSIYLVVIMYLTYRNMLRIKAINEIYDEIYNIATYGETIESKNIKLTFDEEIFIGKRKINISYISIGEENENKKYIFMQK